ncbi:MAG: Rieske (2Fe-2S) protein [Pirellulales bacterium]|nr:Rieske (2Fe-2S) protein [Pirellulales bacterium]
MCQFVTVAKLGDIPEGRGRVFTVGERRVAVFRDGGRYFALDNACPHMGAPLATGDVRDGMVICDRHLWGYRLSDGVCPEVPRLKAETFEVRLEGEWIQVRVPAAG